MRHIPKKESLDSALMAMLGRKDLVDRWWTSPNYYFNLSEPIDLWEKDDEGKLSVAHYIISNVLR